MKKKQEEEEAARVREEEQAQQAQNELHLVVISGEVHADVLQGPGLYTNKLDISSMTIHICTASLNVQYCSIMK